MQIELAYDTTGLVVELPDRNVAAVLRHSPVKPLPDPAGAIAAALRAGPSSAPTTSGRQSAGGSPPLSPTLPPRGGGKTGRPLAEIARGRKNACILICDHTRPAPDRLMLPPLLRELEAAGIPREKILILVATGLHRASSPAEIERMVGPDIARDYRVENHDARDAAAHDFCCVTRGGTRASIDRRFLAADLKIATGFVEPHLMAGFGGGRKMVGIGVASADTICQLHSPAVLENRCCREGNLAGNVLHDATSEIAAAAGLEFILHVTMDEQRRITGVFAGEPADTFDRAVAAIRSQVAARLKQPCDIAVTSGGGFPLDATYYQTIKGVTAAMPAVRQGGTILLVAGCRDGLGSADFQKTMDTFVDFSKFREAILDPRDPYFQIDQWQHEQMSHATAKADVVLAQCKLPADQRARLWIRSADHFRAALDEALAKHGPSATIAVLPQGPYVLVESGN